MSFPTMPQNAGSSRNSKDRYHKPSRRRHQQEHPPATPLLFFSPSPSLPDKLCLLCPSNRRAMKFMATSHASSTSGRRSFLQLRDKPDDTDARGSRMTLTGPAYVSRLAKLSPHQTIESRGLIDQSLNVLAESEIASTVAITLASGHVGGTNVPNNCGY